MYAYFTLKLAISWNIVHVIMKEILNHSKGNFAISQKFYKTAYELPIKQFQSLR